MSLNDILVIERERVLRERVVLTTVYERLKNRINNSVRARAKECIYTIPEFIPGYPLINTVKTMEYLLGKLKREGFIAMQMSMLDLYITWDPSRIRELDSQLKALEPKKREDLGTGVGSGSGSGSGRSTSLSRKLVEKEFERANENFITSLVASKRGSKG